MNVPLIVVFISYFSLYTYSLCLPECLQRLSMSLPTQSQYQPGMALSSLPGIPLLPYGHTDQGNILEPISTANHLIRCSQSPALRITWPFNRAQGPLYSTCTNYAIKKPRPVRRNRLPHILFSINLILFQSSISAFRMSIIVKFYIVNISYR